MFFPIVSNLQKIMQYIYQESLHISGPMPFKPVLFKGQLYIFKYFCSALPLIFFSSNGMKVMHVEYSLPSTYKHILSNSLKYLFTFISLFLVSLFPILHFLYYVFFTVFVLLVLSFSLAFISRIIFS